MKIKKSYTEKEILESAKIGLEFEFYSNLEDIMQTARFLAKFLGKRVVVPVALGSLHKPKPLYHSPVTPSDTIFKLEPDYSGGKKMCELVTGPMPFREARNTIIKVLEWISNNGYTNDRTSIHANISIDENKLPTKDRVQNMNLLKFILSFDEGRVYEVFPNRKDSVYSRSIKEIRANASVFFISPDSTIYSRDAFTVPTEKYYGVNFLKAEKGYLEYRYMGGDNYEKKTKKILDLINYFILHLQSTLNFEDYTGTEKLAFEKIKKEQNVASGAFIKYTAFQKTYPDIKVLFDMNDNPEVIQGVWGNLRDKLFEFIVTGNMKKGEYNYDSELGRFQLKDSVLKNVKVSDVEFLNCEIEGVMEHCAFYDCEIKHSRITMSNFAKGNVVDFSKINESLLHVGNVLNDCFIENKSNIINCEVNKGVIRNGEIGKLAKISKETHIVDKIEPSESPGSFSREKTPEKENKKTKKENGEG